MALQVKKPYDPTEHRYPKWVYPESEVPTAKNGKLVQNEDEEHVVRASFKSVAEPAPVEPVAVAEPSPEVEASPAVMFPKKKKAAAE